MNISGLIEKLEEIKSKEGDIEVRISCDQESLGEPTDKNICTIVWSPEPKYLMLCDSYTFSELQ